MKVHESTTIAGLRKIDASVFYDFRGEYVETFNVNRYKFTDMQGKVVEFLEDDISVSKHGVLRGLHGDPFTWKLIQCLWGEIYFVVVDMRKDSATYLKTESFTLTDKNRWQVLVPAGCANGHLCLTDRCIFSYKQSHLYDGSDKQFTVRWDDPKLKLWWPIKQPLVSQRDSSAAFLP